MLWLLRWSMWAFLRWLLSLRYKVTVTGKGEVLQKPGPYLILPNHPAYMDPPNVLTHLWPAFRMRPLFLETNFTNPFFWLIGYLLRGIRVPETEAASADAKKRAAEAIGHVIDALKAGDNVALWPSGTLARRGGVENVGAARTAADVLAAVPDVTVVLLRCRGFWGSRFSWAYAKKPKMTRELLRGIPQLLTNLLFFTPRRRVTMTLEAFTPGQRPEPRRETINPWLMKWYDAAGPEEPTYVPYHFLFGPRRIEYPPPWSEGEIDLAKVPAEMKQEVIHVVEEKLKRPLNPEETKPETTFAQLGIDSLDGMEIALEVEQRYGFTGGLVPTTLGQLWALAAGMTESEPPKPAPAKWFTPPSDTNTVDIPGETIPAAFLARATRHPKDVVAADDLSGALTYERMMVGSLILASTFRDLPGDHVGLLLPASVGCTVSFLALHLAGKTPVLLNWTTGPVNLEHAAKLTKLSKVVTSKVFVDRTQIAVPGTEYVFLEDVRGTVGKLESLRTLLAVRYFPTRTARKALARLNPDPQQHAVVLFTSGSEKAPKAVPLTHANIVAEERAAIGPMTLTRADSILSFLPMFHSFGLTIAGLFPVLCGVKVVTHPDPTASAALVRKIAAYKPTIVCGTPSFLGFILDRAKPGDLDSLQIIVSGAEKCPDAVFDKAKQVAPKAEILEGYGVTECSPCIAVNPRGGSVRGTLGPPLPGVEVCVTDLDTDEVLPQGKMGMLLVHGPIVFPGYLGHDGPQPFREINGKRWYVTGDLAALDDAGRVVLHGRLKRFLKAGGEMISLPALEEPFTRLYPQGDDGPRAAVEGVETPAGRKIVLFTTADMNLRDANALLQKEGFRGVMRLDEVRKLDKLPTLGTGKTDYKVLRGMIA
jgi:acyl-CoA synthetase (AMP-forming)/AMP-acid ligase II/1-acyl-sn-glycerol-3-phosphate acyltransferase/acyl carrier protein